MSPTSEQSGQPENERIPYYDDRELLAIAGSDSMHLNRLVAINRARDRFESLAILSQDPNLGISDEDYLRARDNKERMTEVLAEYESGKKNSSVPEGPGIS